MSKNEAMEKYIEVVAVVDPEWETQPLDMTKMVSEDKPPL